MRPIRWIFPQRSNTTSIVQYVSHNISEIKIIICQNNTIIIILIIKTNLILLTILFCLLQLLLKTLKESIRTFFTQRMIHTGVITEHVK